MAERWCCLNIHEVIAEAKRRLPLPRLLVQLGLGHHARKSARCPFHDDRKNSFSVYQNEDGVWCWKCHAGCGSGDEINLLEKTRILSRRDTIRLYLELAGIDRGSDCNARLSRDEKRLSFGGVTQKSPSLY